MDAVCSGLFQLYKPRSNAGTASPLKPKSVSVLGFLYQQKDTPHCPTKPLNDKHPLDKDVQSTNTDEPLNSS